jgi:hypothetical protein
MHSLADNPWCCTCLRGNPVNSLQVTLSFDNRGLQDKNMIYNLLSLLVYYLPVPRNSTMTSIFCLCISICTLFILNGITGMTDAVHIKIFNFKLDYIKLLQIFILNISCHYLNCMSILSSLQTNIHSYRKMNANYEHVKVLKVKKNQVSYQITILRQTN